MCTTTVILAYQNMQRSDTHDTTDPNTHDTKTDRNRDINISKNCDTTYAQPNIREQLRHRLASRVAICGGYTDSRGERRQQHLGQLDEENGARCATWCGGGWLHWSASSNRPRRLRKGDGGSDDRVNGRGGETRGPSGGCGSCGKRNNTVLLDILTGQGTAAATSRSMCTPTTARRSTPMSTTPTARTLPSTTPTLHSTDSAGSSRQLSTAGDNCPLL